MNENKKPIYPVSDKEMVAVNLKEMLTVYTDMKRMYYMLQHLIAMVQEEEKLKQHHRPYLHLRREMLVTCEKYLRDMAEISTHTTKPLNGYSLECLCSDKEKEKVEITDKEDTAFFDMLDDVLVLVEHADNLGNFIKLLMNGVNLGEYPTSYEESAKPVIEEMLDRWENYLEIRQNP